MNPHIDSIMQALNFIENHLKETIDMGTVANYAGFSKYHFSRLFREITGMNPYDYYRGRKVTEAMHYLQTHQCKIIDAAYEYGFNSPEVFTRACLSSLGRSPSQIRKSMQDNAFKGIDPLNANELLLIQQYQQINPVLDELPTLLLKGYTFTSNNFYEQIELTNPLITSLLSRPLTDSDFGDTTLYVLHWQSFEDEEIYHHLVGTCVTDHNFDIEDNFSGFIYKQVPRYTYLCFPLIQHGKELKDMKHFVYDHYLVNNSDTSVKYFNVEAIRFDSNRLPQNSMLFIPVDCAHAGRTKKNKRPC